MIEVRSMKNEDLLAYKRLCSICYSYPDTGVPGELPEELLRFRRGVFNEKGDLLSAMMEIPYEVRFCGRTVKMVGIGGVVTDPVARRGGAIRAIFEQDLPRLYQEGQVLSSLYPFSYRFYGKFGYTWATFGQTMTIPVGSLRADLKKADEILRVLPDGEDQGMKEIYAAYIANKDFALLRDESMWKQLRSGTPWESMKHAYVLRMGGKPAAYWVGKVDKSGDEAVLHMEDMAWTCNAGMEAIFAMLRGMNELSSVEVKCRSGFEPHLLCDEAWDVSVGSLVQGMVRVVNAQQALALLPVPVISGSLTVDVQDDQIAENCGRFTVTGDGETLTAIRHDEAPADLKCDIRGLSALVVGRHRFADAVELGLADLVNPEKARFAEMLFADRRLHLNWNF